MEEGFLFLLFLSKLDNTDGKPKLIIVLESMLSFPSCSSRASDNFLRKIVEEGRCQTAVLLA